MKQVRLEITQDQFHELNKKPVTGQVTEVVSKYYVTVGVPAENSGLITGPYVGRVQRSTSAIITVVDADAYQCSGIHEKYRALAVQYLNDYKFPVTSKQLCLRMAEDMSMEVGSSSKCIGLLVERGILGFTNP